MARPRKIDWDTLREEWQLSGLPLGQFLKTKGIDPKAGYTRKATKGWFSRVPQDQKPMRRYASVVVDDVMEAIRKEEDGTLPGAATMWQLYLRWRQNQSCSDYTTAESLREHLRLIVSRNLQVEFVKQEDGTTVEVRTSLLEPSELSRLTSVAESIQKIQRLALGMSTENVGMEMPDSNVEKPAEETDTESGLPVFVVEMSRQGKFMRAKPRQLAGAVQ